MGGCRRTTTEGVVGRQQGGGSPTTTWGVRSTFFGQNRKNRPVILVKRAVSCYMGLVKNSKMANNFVDLTPAPVVVRRQHSHPPHVVIPQLDQMTNFVYRENDLKSKVPK